jgi:hypothetical protein
MSLATYNEATGKALGIGPEALGAATWSDTYMIKLWQTEHQLEADGWFGPASALAFKLDHALRAAGLIVDRQTFRATRTFARVDPARPWSVVLHDSITRSAKDTFKVLESKGSATAYIIPEEAGLPIYQCMDPGTRWSIQANRFNQESIGIDMVSMLDPALLKPKALDDERRTRIREAEWSVSKMKGYAIEYTPSQKERLVKLLAVLADVYGIPRVIPPVKKAHNSDIELNDRTYRGFAAHAHISNMRWDGLWVPELVFAAGWKPWSAA